MGWKVGWRVCSPGRTIKQLKFILRRGLLICFPVIIEGISLVPDPSQVSYKNSFTKYRGCALMTSSRSSSSTFKNWIFDRRPKITWHTKVPRRVVESSDVTRRLTPFIPSLALSHDHKTCSCYWGVSCLCSGVLHKKELRMQFAFNFLC